MIGQGEAPLVRPSQVIDRGPSPGNDRGRGPATGKLWVMRTRGSSGLRKTSAGRHMVSTMCPVYSPDIQCPRPDRSGKAPSHFPFQEVLHRIPCLSMMYSSLLRVERIRRIRLGVARYDTSIRLVDRHIWLWPNCPSVDGLIRPTCGIPRLAACGTQSVCAHREGPWGVCAYARSLMRGTRTRNRARSKGVGVRGPWAGGWMGGCARRKRGRLEIYVRRSENWCARVGPVCVKMGKWTRAMND
jgi:hypothetical protein